MKYINYAIVFIVICFLGVWTFNHINAWAGIGVFVITGYFSISKLLPLIEGILNEEN